MRAAGLRLYADVGKRGAYHRRLFVDTSTLGGWDGRAPLPDGLRVVMEVWNDSSGVAALYQRVWRREAWDAGTSAPGVLAFTTVPRTGCDGCHAGATARQGMWSRPALVAWVRTGVVQQIRCDQPGFTPCPLPVYGRD